jgi:hypothetical protein
MNQAGGRNHVLVEKPEPLDNGVHQFEELLLGQFRFFCEGVPGV